MYFVFFINIFIFIHQDGKQHKPEMEKGMNNCEPELTGTYQFKRETHRKRSILITSFFFVFFSEHKAIKESNEEKYSTWSCIITFHQPKLEENREKKKIR